MLGTVRSMLSGVAGTAQARLELLGDDLRAERGRLAAGALLSAAMLFFAALGILFLAVTVMVAAWDSFRLGAAVLLTLAFLAASGFAALRLRRLAQTQPRVFEKTLMQLEQDRERLARPAYKAPLVESALQAGQWLGAALVLFSVVRRALKR